MSAAPEKYTPLGRQGTTTTLEPGIDRQGTTLTTMTSDTDLKYVDSEKGKGGVTRYASDESLTEARHQDVVVELERLLSEHELDPNFPVDVLARARKALDDDRAGGSGDDEPDSHQEKVRALLAEFAAQRDLLLNDSPYAEVRAVVEPADDPDTPVNTFRVWTMGIFFAIVGTGIDQFFSLRFPSIYVNSLLTQLLAYPLGRLMARVLPTRVWNLPFWGWWFTFNPGPFNEKEHMLIAIMSNVAFGGYNGTAYVTYIIQVLKLDMFYGEKTLANSAAWQILIALSTQLIGYGCAGLTRRFVVYPPAMIWPKALSQIAVNKALHHDDGRLDDPQSGHQGGKSTGGWTISRYRFFMYCFVGMFFYFWIPDYLFQALQQFNWTTWISPNNVKLAIITGTVCGLGLNPWPTFDWNMQMLDPIITPFFSLSNQAISMFIAGFVIIPIMYWNNVWNAAYLPINDNHVFDNTGGFYNISRILNPDFSLNEEEYAAYSPPYLSTANALLYSAFFGLYTAAVVHVALYNRKEVVAGCKSMWWSLRGKKGESPENLDVHNRLMSRYKECPEWWYLCLLAVSFVMACCACALWPTGMPIWGIVLAVAMCLLLQIPIAIILAVTNMEVTLNVIAEYIAGYALEGRAIPNMIFKMFGYIAAAQSIQFSSDLKLAHYVKIPPRLTFAAQTIATVIAAFVSIGVNAWELENIPKVCDKHQESRFICAGTHTFFTASVIWGAVGPRRMFGAGGIYNPLGWGFLVGALLPVVLYLCLKRWPTSWVRYAHGPLLLSGPLGWAPLNWGYMWPSVLFGWFFNMYVRNRWLGWWQKYAYVLTGALSVGIAVAGVVIFFAVQWKSVQLDWWGNNVPWAGVDGGGSDIQCVLLAIPDEGHF